MSKTIKVQVVKKGFKVVKVKAVANEHYLIVDESGKSFNKLRFVQNNKDLEVYIQKDGLEQQIVILENYYAPKINASVVGLDSASNQEIGYVYNSKDTWSYLVGELPETELGFAFPFLGVGIGASTAAGAGIALSSGGSSSGGSSSEGSSSEADALDVTLVKIAQLADNTDNNPITLTSTDIATLGLNSTLDKPIEQTLFTDVIDNANFGEVDSSLKREVIATVVDKIITTAGQTIDDGNTPPTFTTDDFTTIGISGVTDTNLSAVVDMIKATSNDGTSVDSIAELQTIVDVINKIAQLANNTNDNPTTLDNTDILALGLNSTLDTTIEQTLFTDVIDNANFGEVDSSLKREVIATVVDKIITTAGQTIDDGNTPPTFTTDDFTTIGISGVTDTNLSAVVDMIKATSNDGTSVDSIAELQTIVDVINKIAQLANNTNDNPTTLDNTDILALGLNSTLDTTIEQTLFTDVIDNANFSEVDSSLEREAIATVVDKIITTAGQTIGDGNTPPTFTTDDFTTIGISGVTDTNLSAVVDMIKATSNNGTSVDSIAELQTIVDVINKIAQLANNTNDNPTTLDNTDILALGLNSTLDTTIEQTLFTDVIDNANFSEVDSSLEREAIATVVDKIITTASGIISPDELNIIDFTTIGISGVTDTNLSAVVDMIKATSNDGTSVDSIAELQTIVDVINKIAQLADNTDNNLITLTSTDIATLGLNSTLDTTIEQTLFTDVIDNANFSEVDSSLEREAIATVVDKIITTASGIISPDELNIIDFTTIGISGVTDTNLSAVVDMIKATSDDGTSVDSIAELQTIVDVINKIAKLADNTNDNPTTLDNTDILALGLNSTLDTTIEQTLFTDVIDNANFSEVDSSLEREAIATVVDKIITTAGQTIGDGNTPPTFTTDDFTTIGISGVTDTNLSAVVDMIKATSNNGTSVDSIAELQTIVDVINKIAQLANNTNDNPTTLDNTDILALGLNSTLDTTIEQTLFTDVIDNANFSEVDSSLEREAIATVVDKIITTAGQTIGDGNTPPTFTTDDFTTIGISGVTDTNLSAVVDMIKATSNNGTSVDSIAELQTIVDVINKIAQLANNTNDNPITLTSTDIATLGLNSTLDTTIEQTLFTDVIDNANFSEVDSSLEREAIATVVDKIITTASGIISPDELNIIDFTTIGISGVTDTNLSAVVDMIKATSDDGTSVDSIAELQTIVDVINKIAKLADNTNDNPITLTSTDIATLGLNSTLDTTIEQTLFTDVIDNANFSEVDSSLEREAIATVVDKIITTASGIISPDELNIIDFTTIGISGVTDTNLSAVVDMIKATSDDGTSVDSIAELQTIVDVINKIAKLADNTNDNPITLTSTDIATLGLNSTLDTTIEQTLFTDVIDNANFSEVDSSLEREAIATVVDKIITTASGIISPDELNIIDFTTIGISGVTDTNLSAVVDMIKATSDDGTSVDSIAELQTIVDVINKIAKLADNTNDNPITLTSTDIATLGLNSTLDTTIEQTLFTDVIDNANFSEVDSSLEREAIATVVDKIITTASGIISPDELNIIDFTTIGISGVTDTNLSAVVDMIKATSDDGTSVDSIAELQTIVDVINKIAKLADNTNDNPITLTSTDIATLGLNSTLDTTIEQTLFTDVIDNANFSEVDSSLEREAIATVVDKIITTASGIISPDELNIIDFTTIGISGVTDTNLSAVVDMIKATSDDGTSVDSIAELQTIVDVINKIAKLADNTNDNPITLTSTDIATLGLNSTLDTTIEQTLFTDVIDNANFSEVDSSLEREAIATVVDKIITTASGIISPDELNIIDFTTIGISGVTDTNLSAVVDMIKATSDDGTSVDSIAELQTIVDVINKIAKLADNTNDNPITLTSTDIATLGLNSTLDTTIEQTLFTDVIDNANFSEVDSSLEREAIATVVDKIITTASGIISPDELNIIDFTTIGISGVTDTNLSAVVDMIKATSDDGTSVDSIAELQTIVDVINKIAKLADNTNDNPITLTSTDIATLGLNSTLDTTIEQTLFTDVIDNANFSEVDSSLEREAIATVVDKIITTASGIISPDELNIIDFTTIGISGVTDTNLSAVVDMIKATSDDGTSVDSIAELQTIVDVINKIAKLADNTNDNPITLTSTDIATLGLNSTLDTTIEQTLFTDVIDNANFSEVDSSLEREAIATVVDKIITTASGIISPDELNIIDFTTIGISGVTDTNLSAVVDMIKATSDDGTSVDSIAELQTIVDVINKIAKLADNTNDNPITLTSTDIATLGLNSTLDTTIEQTLFTDVIDNANFSEVDSSLEREAIATVVDKIITTASGIISPDELNIIDFTTIGISGVTDTNLSAVVDMIKATSDDGTSVDSIAELQTIVDVINKIAQLANNTNDNPITLTSTDIATLGLNSTLDTTIEQTLFTDVIDNANFSEVDSSLEREAIATVVDKIITTASGIISPDELNIIDFTTIGISGVTDTNLSAVVDMIKATSDDGTSVDSIAELQTIVDVINKIAKLADNTNDNPITLTSTDIATLGLNSTLDTTIEQTLFTDVIDNANFSEVDSSLEREAIATVVDKIITTASGIISPDELNIIDFTTIGISGVTDTNLSAVVDMIKATSDDGTSVDSIAELQTIVDVINKIAKLADNTNDNPITLTSTDIATLGLNSTLDTTIEQTLFTDVIDNANFSEVDSSLEREAIATVVDKIITTASGIISPDELNIIDFTTIGISGVTDTNLSAVVDMIKATSDDGTSVDSIAELQTIVDVINKIAKLADNTNDNPITLTSTDIATLGLNSTLDTTIEQTLFTDVIDNANFSEVDSSLEREAIATVVDKIITTASGIISPDELNIIDFTTIGISGVTDTNLSAVVDMIKATSDDGTSVDSIAELQTIVDVINKIAKLADNTNDNPITLTSTDIATLGLNSTLDTTIEQTLFTDVIDNANFSEVDSSLEREAIATVVDKIITTASGIISPDELNIIDFTTIGISGVTDTNLSAVVDMIKATSDDGTSVDSIAELQTIVDVINKIAKLADNTNDNPITLTSTDIATLGLNSTLDTTIEQTLFTDVIDNANFSEVDSSLEREAIATVVDKIITTASGIISPDELNIIDFTTIGISGVTDTNLSAVVDMIKATSDDGTSVDSIAELQTIVDVINKIAKLADNTNDNPITLTSTDIATLGLNSTLDTTIEQTLFTDVIDNANFSEVDSSLEREAIATVVDKIITTASGIISPDELNIIDFTTIGISGVTDTNLSAVVDMIKATSDDGTSVDSIAELQTIVDVINKIAKLADNTNDNPITLTSTDIATLGLNSTLDTTIEQTLFTDVIDNANFSEVDSSLEREAIATVVDKIITTASGIISPDELNIIDFTTIGISGVTDTNLSAVVDMIKATSDDGTSVDSIAELQTIVDVINKIAKLADNTNDNPITLTSTDIATLGLNSTLDTTIEQTLFTDVIDNANFSEVDSSLEREAIATVVDKIITTASGIISPDELNIIDFTTIGISGVTDTNLSAVVDMIKATSDDGTSVDSIAELQTIVDVINKIAKLADNTNDNPITLTSTDIATLGLNSTLDTTIEQTLFTDVIDNANFSEVDSSLEREAIATVVDKIITTASGIISPDELNIIDFTTIGIDNLVDNDNLNNVKLIIKGTANDGSGVDSLAKIKVLIDIAQLADNTDNDGKDTNNNTEIIIDNIDLELLGLNSIINSSIEQTLFTDVLDNSSIGDIDDASERNKLAEIVDKIITTAAQTIGDTNTPPTFEIDDFTKLGVTGVDANNLANVVHMIKATADDGTSVNSVAKIQALIKIVQLANNTNDNPTTLDNTDILALGLNSTLNTTIEETLFTDVIDNTTIDKVDDVSEREAIATLVDKIITTAGGGTVTPALQLSDFAYIGINNTTDSRLDLSLLIDIIKASSDDGSDIDSLVEIQSIVNAIIKIKLLTESSVDGAILDNSDITALGVSSIIKSSIEQTLFTDIIDNIAFGRVNSSSELLNIALVVNKIMQTATQTIGDGNTPPTFTVSDFTNINLLNVTATNMNSLIVMIKDTANEGTGVDSISELKTLVKIIRLADNTDNNTVLLDSTTDIINLGLSSIIDTSEKNNLFIDVLDNIDIDSVDTKVEIQNLAIIVDKIIKTAVDINPVQELTLGNFESIGITGVTATNLTNVINIIKATADSGTDINGIAKIQTLVDIVVLADGMDNNSLELTRISGITPDVSDMANLGLSSILNNDVALILFTDVIDNLQFTEVDTNAKLVSIALIVGKIKRILDQDGSTLIVDDFNKIGITGVNNFNLDDVVLGIESSVGISTITEIQNIVNNPTTPLILDLNKDGIHTTSLSNSSVIFDNDANGIAEHMAWSDAKDGFLVLDINKDGSINDGSELFGSGTTLANGTKASNGYEALAQYDENSDKVIDANDSIFESLQIWLDTNVDGKTDITELHMLQDFDIASLGLNFEHSSQTNNENLIGLVSNWIDTTGQTHDMADVWLSTQKISQNSIVDTSTWTQNSDVASVNLVYSNLLQTNIEEDKKVETVI